MKFEYGYKPITENAERVVCGITVLTKPVSSEYAYARAQELLIIADAAKKSEDKLAAAERDKHIEENIIPLAFDMYNTYMRNDGSISTVDRFADEYRGHSYAARQWVRTAEAIWDKFNK